jgi:hypothetical protein
MGNPIALSSAPNFFLEYTNQMAFFQRMENLVFTELFDVFATYYFAHGVHEVLKQYLPDIPHSIYDLYKNTSLFLLNTDISVDYPRPLLPNVKEVGGMHCVPANPLPEDLEKFVSKNGSKGFIYFSLGSTVKGIYMPKHYRKNFVEAFSKLPDYQVKLNHKIQPIRLLDDLRGSYLQHTVFSVSIYSIIILFLSTDFMEMGRRNNRRRAAATKR